MESNHVITEPCLRRTNMAVSSNTKSKDEYLKELMKRHRFWVAASKQNEVADTAIKSLDCLNEQIVQYIVSGRSSPIPEALSVADDNDEVKASVVLMRRLLLDAQGRFRRMVEDNRQLAAHIDDSIQAANQEVNLLRAELASTNKRLSQISIQEIMGKSEVGTQVEMHLLLGDSDTENIEQTVTSLTSANQQLMADYKALLENHDVIKVTNSELKSENEKVQNENQRLASELLTLQREYEEIRQIKMERDSNGTAKPSYGELKLELIQTRQELTRAKEVLQGLKSDRKRLKGEKLDLLSQMKQLYATLEEKETELRDFIRNYEQRVKESDDMIKQVDMLAREKEETDHEKWEIITKARDAAERAVFFRAQLDNREQRMKSLETELAEAKKMLANLGQTFPSPTMALSSSVGSSTSNDNNNFLMCNADTYSISSTGEDTCLLNFNTSTSSTPMLGGRGLAVSTPVLPSPKDSTAPLVHMCSQTSEIGKVPDNNSEKVSNDNGQATSSNSLDGGKKKKKSFHGFSRMFTRARVRRSVTLSKGDSINHDETLGFCAKLCVLNQDNYQEKLATVEHMQGLDMKEWRAHQVLAWLEITLSMPMYAISCLHNIKSGKVLLGLSDSELSSALGVCNHIHRRKLRLSIEQHRNPNEIKYPKANEMDPTWIAHRFLPDLGLPQYTSIFEEQLCDGHIINTLTRKDLEKYFSVHRKFHQSSIMHAVELLRRIDFNKEKLYKRRTASDDVDTDLIVWTNERLIKWIRSIDLGEYTDNLQESGLHGAVMVLEPSFCSDVLASMMGIPPSKSYIRRHLTEELDAILKPARAALDSPESPEEITTGKEKKFSRGRHSSTSDDGQGRSRLSFRGSLGRAFGKKVKDDLKLNFDSEGSKKKISAPIPIQQSLDSNAELLKKGFCLPDPTRNGAKLPQVQGLPELQRSLSATGASNKTKPRRANSEDKSGKPATGGDESAPKRTVVDLVKGLKSDAAAARAAGANGKTADSWDGAGEKDTKPADKGNAAKSDNKAKHQKESSLASSSSQDTLTEQSVVEPISRQSSHGGKDDHNHSQTESVSQSSSTESALEEKSTVTPPTTDKLLSKTPHVTAKPPLQKSEAVNSTTRSLDGNVGQIGSCSRNAETGKNVSNVKKAASLLETSQSTSV